MGKAKEGEEKDEGNWKGPDSAICLHGSSQSRRRVVKRETKLSNQLLGSHLELETAIF